MDAQTVAYFVRHGSTSANNGNEFRGPIDFPLAPDGVKQAEDLNKWFKDIGLGSAYSSDMDRAMHTAEVTLRGKGIEASPTPDLRSWNVGKFAGLPKPPNEFQIKYYQDNPDEKIPEGESLNQFRKRVQPRIKTAIMAGIHTGVPSVSFVHSSVVREVSHIINGDHTVHKVKPGGVMGVQWDGKKLSTKALFRPERKDQGYGA